MMREAEKTNEGRAQRAKDTERSQMRKEHGREDDANRPASEWRQDILLAQRMVHADRHLRLYDT